MPSDGITVQQLVDDWTRACRRQGNSPGTEGAYSWALGHFTRFAAELGVDVAGQITSELIDAFQDWLIESGKSRQSQRIASTALRELLRWAASRRLVLPELHLAVSRVKVPKGMPKPLSEDDLRALLLHLLPRHPRMSVMEARDRALFLYLLGSSARVSEVLQVTRHEFEKAWVVQKGGGQQLLLAPPLVLEAVKLYVALRKDASDFLWITFDSNKPVRPLTPEGVRSIWARLARLVGVPHFTTHQLRHTAATLLLDKGVQESVVANHMGHSDLSTLLNYARISPRRRQEALGAMQGFLEQTVESAQPGARVEEAAASGPESSEGYVTVKGAAGILGVTDKAVRQLSDTGRLAGWRTTGGQRRFSITVVKRLRDELNSDAPAAVPAMIVLPTPEPEKSLADERGYLSFLIKEAEGHLGELNALGKRLASLLPGPSPNQALPLLRVIEGGGDGAPRTWRPGSEDDFADDPAAIEVRMVFSPARGIVISVAGGDEVGLRDGLRDFGGLITANPHLPELLISQQASARGGPIN